METAAIDLFCGIGGLSYGLKKAGISVLAGLDLDGSCKYIYEENVKAKFLHKDITEVEGVELEKIWTNKQSIRILAGCAPCQPFSTHANKNKDRKKSVKWNLIDEFRRLIGEINPDVVTMENVPNISKQKVFADFVDFLRLNNYFISYSNIYCPDYGIPQKRRRLVLFASKFGNISIIPPTHSQENYETLKMAIGDLPPVEAGVACPSDPLHRTLKLTDINLQRIKASKPGGTWLDWREDLKLPCHKKKSGRTYKAVYGRMSWDEPSSTITTQFSNYGTGRFGHPIQNRALTVREAAILQTFPLDYKFYKNEDKIPIKRVSVYIGNAVPVDLGVVIGKSIMLHLEGQNGNKE
jgi:DNA (cytosine-5)-methyltransferase 1